MMHGVFLVIFSFALPGPIQFNPSNAEKGGDRFMNYDCTSEVAVT